MFVHKERGSKHASLPVTSHVQFCHFLCVLIMYVLSGRGRFCRQETRWRWNSDFFLRLACSGVNLTWLDTGITQINYRHQCWHRAMFAQLLAGTVLTYQTNRTFILKPQSPWHSAAAELWNVGVHYRAVTHSTRLVWISDALEELMFSGFQTQFAGCLNGSGVR